jgi:hypothetical protein
MNDFDNKPVTRHGKTYHYDPDHDIYCPEHELSQWDSWGWLAVILVLAAMALYFEFWPIR